MKQAKPVLIRTILLMAAFAVAWSRTLAADPPSTATQPQSERASSTVATFQEQAKKLEQEYVRKLKELAEQQTKELDEAVKKAVKKGDLQEATELLSAKLKIQALAAAKQERHAADPPLFTCETFTWRENQQPTKMIRKEEGFCYLSGINGGFVGGAESGLVYIGDDGYWYLKGLTNQGFLRLQAVAVKLKR